MITENLSTLKIHKLSKEQYERESANGTLDTSALYLTPEEGVDLSKYATIDSVPTKISQLTNDSGYITDPVFKNMGLNTVNIDDEYRHNYVVGLSENGHGTYPITGGWLTVTNYANDHFATQTAYTCVQSDDATRDVQMWVRERYYGGSWSSWKKIIIGNVSKWIDNGLDIWGTQGDWFAYSTNPNTKPSIGLPAGLSEYGTIFGTCGSEYPNVIYIDVFGTMASYNTHENHWRITDSNTTYSLSKSGSTIILTGSDGSVSSVEDNADSGSTSSSGMKREFNTGAINTTDYITESNESKIYIVTVIDTTNIEELTTLVFDYMAAMSASGNGYIQYVCSYDKQSKEFSKYGVSMFINTTGKQVTFSASGPLLIAHICGYY